MPVVSSSPAVTCYDDSSQRVCHKEERYGGLERTNIALGCRDDWIAR